jgi:hypothetical protein
MKFSRFFCLGLVVFLTSCSVFVNSKEDLKIEGVGEAITKNFNVDMFRYLEIDVNSDVELIQSDSLYVQVVGQKNIVDLLDVSVSNSHMIIKFKRNLVHTDPLKFIISVPSIQKIELNGAGKFVINSWKNEDRLQFVNNGSSEFDVANLNHIKHLQIEINGSGSFLAKENSEVIHSVVSELNGSGDINLEKFHISHAKLEVNGSGNVELGEVEQLHVEIVGSGNVTYMGHPKIHQEIIGSGSVNQK